jgi:UDP-N-acetylglucosamine--N-acetylmuramyl-(pentapeptide) pyrophosphoryl-undecaprenol N-acetylglucosamine transferase
MLLKLERTALMNTALEAKKMQKTAATEAVVRACEELAT